jgi:hypothetical protein
MAKKKKKTVVSNLSVAASGGYIAGANVDGQDGQTPAGLVNSNSDGLISASQSGDNTPTPQPTQVQAGLTDAEVQAKIDAKLEAAAKLEADAKSKADLKASLEKIECSDDAEAQAIVMKAKAGVDAGQEIHAGLVEADVKLALARNKRAVPNVNMNASVNAVKPTDALEAAFALTYAPGVAAKMAESHPAQVEAGQKLGQMGLKAMASHAQIAAGGNALTFGSTEQDIMAALSTSSIPTIVSNVANKYIAERFTSDDAVSVIRRVTKAKTVNDFKVNTGARLAAGGAFSKIAEGEEIPLANITDASYTHKADMYGQRIGITRQMIINDDLGMLMDLVDHMVMNGMDAFVDTFVAALKAADGSGFFAAGNSNIDAGGEIPSPAGYKKMNELFAGMTDDKGRKTQVMPQTILSPADLIAHAQEMYVSTEIRDTTASKARGTRNIYASRYEPLQLNYLDAAEWYGFADPQRTPAFVASYLFGRQMPTILPAQTQYKDLSEMMVGYFDFGIDEAMTQGAVKMK